MARLKYRTVRGQLVDWDKFRALHTDEISVGNMGVNARGDQVNSHGDIIKTRNELMKEKYLDPKAKYNPVRQRSASNTTVSQPVAQSTQQSESSESMVEEYQKPGVVDIRHRIFGQTGKDLRGSLANSVSLDLTTPEAPKPTTLRRI